MTFDFDSLKKKYGRFFVWIFLVLLGLVLLKYNNSEQLGGMASTTDLNGVKDLLMSFDLT